MERRASNGQPREEERASASAWGIVPRNSGAITQGGGGATALTGIAGGGATRMFSARPPREEERVAPLTDAEGGERHPVSVGVINP